MTFWLIRTPDEKGKMLQGKGKSEKDNSGRQYMAGKGKGELQNRKKKNRTLTRW